MTPNLDGCTVVITRERRGELGRRLDDQGARVVHVPLIEVVDADPTSMEVAWSSDPDWLVVTSAAGADRVATEVVKRPRLRLAAVGEATAKRLEAHAGRPVDLVPRQQRADVLVEEFLRANDRAQRVLVAQADRAAPTVVDRLIAAGHDVTVAVAYSTRVRAPDRSDLDAIAGADAVVFASGSAALGWADAFGADAVAHLPKLVVAIGPTTAQVASESGLKVTHVAADHSLAGVIDELIRAWAVPG